MKEAYEKPEVEVVMFDNDDIVNMTNTSGGAGGSDFGDGGHFS